MIAVALALGAAATWGTGDFLGGMAARRYPLLWVLLASSIGGLAIASAGGLIAGDPIPSGGHLALAGAAGVVALVALASFYRALAIGTMSIVAPISSLGVAVPVLWGVLGRGEHLSGLAIVAIFVALAGVILASREQDTAQTMGVDARLHRNSIALALVAALCFGTVFVLIAEAGSESIYWPAAALKVVTLMVVILLLIAAGARRATWNERPRGVGWAFPVSIGFFDASANMMFAAATHHGAVSISSVVSALYPIATVLLAFVLLHERLVATQWVGVALALTGAVMLAAA